MAALKQSSATTDNAIRERRLRPIYDCLDNGNNKKALQEAVKLLKKQENFLCAKVLKALALIRLGRQNESTSILEEVHRESPADETTLQAMTICYWESHKPELIANAYENASKKDPLNEEFLTHLFMAYVRLGEHKKQQQAAMALYKVKPKNPYYFWAVMSIVMQARTSDDKLAKSIILPLAQKMTEKIVKGQKIEAEAEVELYLMILNLQNKYQEALEVIDGPLKEILECGNYSITLRRAKLLEHLGRWPEAHQSYEHLLLEKPDNWSFYDGYLNSMFKMFESPIVDKANDFEKLKLEKADAFIKSQISREDSKYLRGPHLANIELVKLFKNFGGNKHNLQLPSDGKSLSDLLIDYFQRFGSKMCCFGDLRPYIDCASEADKHQFLEFINNKFNGGSELVSNVKELQAHITSVELRRYLKEYDKRTREERFELVDKLIGRHESSLKFNYGLPETDIHPGNNYCILAIHLLIDMCNDGSDSGVLLKAISYLEWALIHSPQSHQFKLLLIKLYVRLGAVVPAFHNFNSMDIKHIQLDTIGYIITRYLTSYSYFSAACTVYGNTLRFFSSNDRDTIDYLISSYKYGSFNKIYEFVKFRERLNDSMHYAKITAERMVLDLIIDTYSHDATEQVICFMVIEPEKDKVNWDCLRDNRDFDVMLCWDSSFGGQTIAQQTSYLQDMEWLKMRQLIIRSIAAAVLLTKSVDGSDDRSITNGIQSTNTLQDLIDKLKIKIDDMSSLKYKSKWSLAGPYESRLILYARCGHPDLLLDFLLLVLNLYRASENLSQNNDYSEKLSKIAAELSNKLKGVVAHVHSLSENLADPSRWSEFLESSSNVVESFSLILIILGSCQRILKPSKLSLLRKGKKKNKENVPAVMCEALKHYENLFSVMSLSLQQMRNLVCKIKFEALSHQLSSLSITDNKHQIKEIDETYTKVQKNIRESYETSLKELGDLIVNKIKYLSSIKLS